MLTLSYFYVDNYNLTCGQNHDSFLPSISSFFSLIALSKTSSRILKRSGERGHLCLLCDLSRKDFSFTQLSTILAVGLLQIFFIKLKKFPLES